MNQFSKIKDIIIPAAGMGTRLKHKTKNCPKILVEIYGKTILEHQLSIINQFNNFERIHFILGYKSEMLKSFIENLNLSYKIKFYFNDEFSNTGCSFSLMKVLRKLKASFLYLNSDLIVSKESINLLTKSKKKNIILVRDITNKQETVLQKVEIKNNKVLRMELTLDKPYNAEAVGPVKISSEAIRILLKIYDSLDQNVSRHIPCYSLFGLFATKNELSTKFISDNHWIEINDLEDFENAKDKLLHLSN